MNKIKNMLIILLFIGISTFFLNYINVSVKDNIDYLTRESSDTLTVNFEYGENISPTATWKNIYAIWMEDTTSNFIQNIFICQKLVTGGVTGTALPYWKINKYPISSGTGVDAVTGATKANTDFSVSAILKDSTVRKFNLFFEVDRSFEPNDWFSDQPALLYSIPINLDDTTTNYELIPIGWTPNESAQNKIPNTPIGKLQKEMKYITNHKVGSSFGDADKRSSTKMVKKITATIKKSAPANLTTQSINFTTGWNIMSFYVLPKDTNLKNVLQPLISAGSIKKVIDEEGKTLEDRGISGGWQNEIGNLSATRGYNINVTSPGTLSVEGSTFIFPFHIQLTGGWNIISWPSPNEQEGMEVLNALISEGKLIKVMDEAGKTIEDWGNFGGWKNNIGNLKPGEGYKVKVTGDCTLIINESGTIPEVVVPDPLASVHFIPAFKGNGTEHMNIHVVNLTETGIKAGDEIGVFDGDICVGAVKIPNQFLTAVSIPASANDGLEEKNGFTADNTIVLRLYRSGAEYQVSIHALSNGETVFKKGNSLFAQIGIPSGLPAFKGIMEVKCYPNPFSKQVTIDIMLAAKQKTVVKVYDNKGALVRTLFENEAEGKIAIYWDGRNQAGAKMISGTYFVKVNDATFKVLLE